VRVVVVSAWEPWRRSDGAALILDRQLQILTHRHDIEVLAAGAPRSEADPCHEGVAPTYGSSVRWYGRNRGPAIDHLTRRARSLRSREPAHVGYVERPGLLSALDEAIGGGVDVVHLHGWGTAALWRRAPGVPTVHVAVDPWSANAQNRRVSRPRRLTEIEQRPLIAAHERRHYPHHGAIVVVASRDAETIRRLAPAARVEVIPNGVDLGPEPSHAPDRPVLGFHGVFDSQANVDGARHLVERILPAVRRTVPAAEVRVVGYRPPREIRALAAPGVAVIADAVDMRSELAQIVVHVDWMTSGTGLKNKVLEAMAAARPVVASRLGAEGIGEGPGLLVADDIDDAAATVSDLLRDRRVAAETGRAGRARVATDFGWDANAARIEALWADVVGR
jgi:glycosyltransferase involved in cell wall biosynthesis